MGNHFFSKHRKLTANIGWLIFEKFFRLILNCIFGIWFARYLGPSLFGVWNHALAFSAIFGVFASFTIDNIVIKELNSPLANVNKLMGTFWGLKLFFGILFLTISTTWAFLADHQVIFTSMVFLSGLGIILQSPSVVESYFQFHIKSRLSVASQSLAFLIVICIKFLLIIFNSHILFFALAGTIEMLLASIFILNSFQKEGQNFRLWEFDSSLAKKMVKEGLPIIFASLAVIINLKIDQIMLGNMVSEKALGVYSVAVRLSEMWHFVPVAIVSSMSRHILEAKAVSTENFNKNLGLIFKLLFWLSFFFAVFATILSDHLILTLFGEPFAESAGVLRLLVWSGLFISMGVASNCFFLAENLWSHKFYATLIGAATNVCLNLLLIPRFSIYGAAWATLFSYFALAFSVILFPKSRRLLYFMLESINFYPLFGVKIGNATEPRANLH